jgi:hypothetical protein
MCEKKNWGFTSECYIEYYHDIHYGFYFGY